MESILAVSAPPTPAITTALRRISSTGLSLYRLSTIRPSPVSLVRFSSPFSSTKSTLKRRYNPLPDSVKMDVQALTSRLTTLGLSTSSSSSSSSEATPVLSYFFNPKSGSKHPDNAEQDLKLVVVAIEEAKNLGPAKALAASVGLKDMRAVSGADLEKLIGRTRDQGEYHELIMFGLAGDRRLTPQLSPGNSASPLSLPAELAPSTLVITSNSLSSASTISVPSPSNPSESLTLSSADFEKLVAQLKSEGAAVKQAEFVVKGAEP